MHRTSSPESVRPSQRARTPRQWLYALWKFSRPHTIIGTSLSVLGVYLVARSYGGTSTSWLWLLGAWLACIFGNVYIVGLNQLEDVAIDRINKPHLPLASGEFSLNQGRGIVLGTGIAAIALASVQGPFLLGMVALSLAIGTAYSLPPIRLKRSPFWASLCIFSVRGAIVNLGLFLHATQKLGLPLRFTPEIIALTLFVLVFTFAIAIFKDIPDLEGDRQYNISTFTVRLGPQAVFDLSRWVLTACYGGMALGAIALPGANAPFLVATHLGALGLFWALSTRVDLQSQRAIADFYQFIWKLFFLEYLLFPAACLLS
ncbi:homogentisate phytyltransferase [Geitlerinema sp. PCC 7407]|uniref:homogentisate phytyltransferase n=1 Tax=Geitlerinema sp. PCC 7407 TaxID=1173025 RepID=UPI00029F91C1|nr:homogentisate phytyltransferase [Geitlerinema sp. PCC 7407]AFY64572.1 homogentisate phytyltransferase [Geitlerinema sp. PCC 7407]